MASAKPPPGSSVSSVTREVEALMRPAIRKIIRENTVEKAKSFASAANMPDEFVDGIEVRDGGFTAAGVMDYDIVNTFKGKFGEPLAEWFEEGTKRNYKIRPKLDHPVIGFSDAAPTQGAGYADRMEDEEPRNIYTERDVAYVEHGDETRRQHPAVLSWERDGVRYYRKEVTHPGREAVLSMYLAQSNSIEEVRRAAKAAVPRVRGYEVSVEVEWIPGGADG